MKLLKLAKLWLQKQELDLKAGIIALAKNVHGNLSTEARKIEDEVKKL